MNCVICKNGTYSDGTTTVVLTTDDSAVIIRHVPALICDQCGEYILSEEVTDQVMRVAMEAKARGAEVEICNFAA